MSNLNNSLTNLRERYIVTEERVETLWKDRAAPAHSPRQLNERGQKILNQSGIKSIIDDKKDHLLSSVRQQNPTTAYDAEQVIEKVVADLPKQYPEIETGLKNGAFSVGADVDVSEVLFVGSVYIRDKILADLGFTLTNLEVEKN